MANSKRKCTGCKENFPVEQMMKLPIGWFCSTNCASGYAVRRSQKAREREAKKVQAKVAQEIKSRRKALKTKPQWLQEAQSAFNKFVRIRDSRNNCISCGCKLVDSYGGTTDAGHFRSRGSAPHLRFNLYNCHSQCSRCNRYLSGNISSYRIGLIEKIGLERVERLEQDHTSKTYTIEYLERVKRIFNKRARLYAKLRQL